MEERGLVVRQQRNTGSGRITNEYRFTDTPGDCESFGLPPQGTHSPRAEGTHSPRPRGLTVPCKGTRSTELDPLELDPPPPKSPVALTRGDSEGGGGLKDGWKEAARRLSDIGVSDTLGDLDGAKPWG